MSEKDFHEFWRDGKRVTRAEAARLAADLIWRQALEAWSGRRPIASLAEGEATYSTMDDLIGKEEY